MRGENAPLPERHWEIPYNGTPYLDRCKVTPIQSAAFRNGVLRRPTHCTICDLRGPAFANGRAQFVAHLERYDHPYEIYPVCRPCHRDLHARFVEPGRWKRLLDRHGRSGSWFVGLTTDAASQALPFVETYPAGLPPLPYSLLETDLFGLVEKNG
ncbi:MAG: hypothetical protein JWO15_2673 [Sphingomonadales bacterium]|nr:hypothetical protein [Sphingomonadales bacterium]